MSNTYTFTQKPAPSEPGQLSNFSGVANDGNHVAMTGVIASGPQMKDISATPVVSPATISNTAVTTITVPLNAATFHVIASTNSIDISESDPTVATSYFTLIDSTVIDIDVARCAYLYLKANTGNATVSFWFDVV